MISQDFRQLCCLQEKQAAKLAISKPKFGRRCRLSLSESLQLIETIVLTLTAFIVFWYTRETYKLRKITNEQNLILAEQLNFMREKFNVELTKETFLYEPIIEFKGGNIKERQFINKGKTIKNLSVVTNQNFSVNIHPQEVIASGQKGFLRFGLLPKMFSEKLRFEIHYEDLTGKKGVKYYILIPEKNQIVEEKITSGQ